MWLMLQQEVPEDFVIATGKTHSVREFVELAFHEVGIEIEWSGEGINEVGIDKKTRDILIEIDPRYYRPTEVELLLGDSTKAKEKLGWEAKVGFRELVKMMIEGDMRKL
jgi:GDPmannose 4,6-dehydratase